MFDAKFGAKARQYCMYSYHIDIKYCIKLVVDGLVNFDYSGKQVNLNYATGLVTPYIGDIKFI